MEDRFLVRGKVLAGSNADDWVYGYYVGSNEPIDLAGEIYAPTQNPSNGYKRYVVDETTIGQCTGLKDKNGKLIFEGDILFDDHTEEYAKVIFDEAKFCLKSETITWGLFDVVDEFEVVGNIHDNPKLLEVGCRKY